MKLVEDVVNDTVLVMNSDLFTNIDFEEFFLHFRKHDADLSIAAIFIRMMSATALANLLSCLIRRLSLRKLTSYLLLIVAKVVMVQQESDMSETKARDTDDARNLARSCIFILKDGLCNHHRIPAQKHCAHGILHDDGDLRVSCKMLLEGKCSDILLTQKVDISSLVDEAYEKKHEQH